MAKKGEPRAPHKPDCSCVICQKTREKASIEIKPVPSLEVPPRVGPVLVPAGSLKPGTIFEFNGLRCRAGHRDVDFITAANIGSPGSVPITLGLSTIIKLIK